MDDQTRTMTAEVADAPAPDPGSHEELRRDRLLAGVALIGGLGLLLGLPFALQGGSAFFLPTTAAFVIAVALVPILEWLERHRVPSALSALACVLLFLTVVNVALASIVVPAWSWISALPDRIERIQGNIAPLLDLYSNLERYTNRLLGELATQPPQPAADAPTAPPASVADLFSTSAPSALLEMFFALLLLYFLLSGWTRFRHAAITNRASFGGAMATARVIQNVVDDTSAYLGTISVINALLGVFVAGLLWLIDMPTPLMWGGIVALLNFVPYLGPIVAAALLTIGGLMTYDGIWMALAPAAIMTVAHLIEANLITPLIVGHRLTVSPVLILISLSFWGWVWGTPGALLAVPLLIIIQTVLKAAGKPDIAGFLFEHGTLVHDPPTGDAANRARLDQSP